MGRLGRAGKYARALLRQGGIGGPCVAGRDHGGGRRMTTDLPQLNARATAGSESVTDRAYAEIKAMVVAYSLKPGERINEVELSRKIGVSRTPLPEALSRLN